MGEASDTAGELQRLREALALAQRQCAMLAERVHELERLLGPARTAGVEIIDFEQAFRIEQSRAKRLRHALSLAMLEVDSLQELRDLLGHAAGEHALAHLHATLTATLRPTDVVARLDGLQSAVLLTATTLEQGLMAVARLQQTIAAHPYVAHGCEHALSVCIGIVQWRSDEPLSELLSRASRALGLARRGGPGKVVVG
jgi:diguanylate cyclase (GGDEF)-like protein